MQPLATPEKLLESIGSHARDFGVKVYAVGGYIRDRLLGLPFNDEIDLSVVGDGPGFAKYVAKKIDSTQKVQIYQRFGTARVQAGNIQLEFATSRRESYSEDSRNPEVEPAPFEQDLARRDFTVNALAVDLDSTDKIIDLFDGLDDLENKIIRTPLDPEKTFADDPLRILRAIRFSVRLSFDIHPQTWSALKQESGRLNIVARERINDEFFKILVIYPPSRGLTLLHDSGVLETIFPEIASLAGVEQKGKHHHKDVLRHTFQVIDSLASRTENIRLVFAALVHDIGKPRTKFYDENDGWTFHGHEHVGERIVRKMGKSYLLGDELTQYASKLVRLHMRPINLNDSDVTDSAIRRLVVQAGDQIDDLLTLCRADITSSNPRKVKKYLADFDHMVERMKEVEEKDRLRSFQSPIRGAEIMERTGLSEGPRVGLIKALIEEEILDGNIPNSTDGANSIFDSIVKKVINQPDKDVLVQLREIMRLRNS